MAERVMDMIRDRRLGDENVRKALDEMPYRALVTALGEPHVNTFYAEPKGYWTVGDGRPSLASESPAIMQAIGRCVTARTWDRRLGIAPGGIHPSECGWDEYPVDELLKACDWAVWHSRFVVTEYAVWKGAEESPSYSRGLRSGVYENPVWASFFALPKNDRAWQIDQAAAR